MADPSKKIDMSLDDIIKLNKKQKKSNVNQQRTKFQTNSKRGRQGGNRRGGAKNVSQWRGRAGVSPLNRVQNKNQANQTTQRVQKFQQVRGRGRGRGQTRGRGRLTLQQQRENALIALQDAKKRLASLNSQKRSRDDQVNQQRGIQNFSNRGRGRGRGRGNGFRINRNFNTQVTQSQPAQSFLNRNLTVSNRQTGRSRGGRQQRRQWRGRSTAVVAPRTEQVSDDSILTISINNQPSFSPRKQPPPQHDTEFTEEIMNLRPTKSKKYQFQKNFFSRASTSISLSDRFADGEEEDESRKVFF